MLENRLFQLFSLSFLYFQIPIIRRVSGKKFVPIRPKFSEIIEKLDYILTYRHIYISGNAQNELILIGKQFLSSKLLVFEAL